MRPKRDRKKTALFQEYMEQKDWFDKEKETESGEKRKKRPPKSALDDEEDEYDGNSTNPHQKDTADQENDQEYATSSHRKRKKPIPKQQVPASSSGAAQPAAGAGAFQNMVLATQPPQKKQKLNVQQAESPSMFNPVQNPFVNNALKPELATSAANFPLFYTNPQFFQNFAAAQNQNPNFLSQPITNLQQLTQLQNFSQISNMFSQIPPFPLQKFLNESQNTNPKKTSHHTNKEINQNILSTPDVQQLRASALLSGQKMIHPAQRSEEPPQDQQQQQQQEFSQEDQQNHHQNGNPEPENQDEKSEDHHYFNPHDAGSRYSLSQDQSSGGNANEDYQQQLQQQQTQYNQDQKDQLDLFS